MERYPVHAPIMFQHELDNSICGPKHIRLTRVRAGHLKSHRSRGRVLLPQPRDIPYTYALIQGSADDEVFFRMELGAHRIVIMTGHRADQLPILPIPYTNRLIIQRRRDPRQLVVEENCPDVIQMTIEVKRQRRVVRDQTLILWSSPPETNSSWVRWKSTPRTRPSCSSNLSIKVTMR